MLAPSARGPLLATLLPALLATTLTGCAAMEPPLEDPRGVDSLVVPTPSLDADDLTAVIDHPWLAADARAEGESGLLVQDEAGHVWLETDAGGPAGLWLPADPRRGDGWVVVPGNDPRVATVVAADPELVVDLTGGSRPPARYTYRQGEGLLTVDGG